MKNINRLNKNKVKILISYKRECNVISSEIIKPIQTGCSICNKIFDNMIRDDSGDNISFKNEKYCELTAQYWAWKNYDKLGNPDYIGFMHYRRFIIFNEYEELPSEKWLPQSKWYLDKRINKNYFSDASILKEINKGFDCYTVKMFDYSCYTVKSIIEEFKCFGILQELYKCQKIVEDLYPEYGDVSKKVLEGEKKFLCNMFVMKKELFFKYNSFLFNVLDSVDNSVNSEYFFENKKRFLGYLGEYLFTVFVLKNKLSIRELSGVLVDDVAFSEKEIAPVFRNNYSVLGISCSNEYVPYLSVCLSSLKQHANENKNYDIIIFERNITEKNKDILRNFLNKKNISIRFFNISYLLENRNLKCQSCYTLESYLILFLPEILKKYQRIIFTDCDLVFNDDISNLYNIDMYNYPVAASQDIVMGMFLNDENADWNNYLTEDLELKEPYKYFNSGVMIYNLEKCRDLNFTKITIDIAEKKLYRTFMQCLLNKFFKNNVYYFGLKFNYTVLNEAYLNMRHIMPLIFKKEYNNLKHNASIYHWAGGFKPWFYPNEELANIWWSYARKTPFYEEILARLIDFKISQASKGNNIETQTIFNNNMRMLYLANHFFRFKLKKLKYRLLKHITFGRRKEKYKTKYKALKSEIKAARRFVKELKKSIK